MTSDDGFRRKNNQPLFLETRFFLFFPFLSSFFFLCEGVFERLEQFVHPAFQGWLIWLKQCLNNQGAEKTLNSFHKKATRCFCLSFTELFYLSSVVRRHPRCRFRIGGVGADCLRKQQASLRLKTTHHDQLYHKIIRLNSGEQIIHADVFLSGSLSLSLSLLFSFCLFPIYTHTHMPLKHHHLHLTTHIQHGWSWQVSCVCVWQCLCCTCGVMQGTCLQSAPHGAMCLWLE